MLVFKPVFLKQFRQFHFLKPLDIFMRLLKYAKKVRLQKKVTLREVKEEVRSAKSVSRYKKLQTTQVENLPAVSHFNIKHL